MAQPNKNHRFFRVAAACGAGLLELHAAEATGEGLMRWAPDGRNIVAKWDFVVEND